MRIIYVLLILAIALSGCRSSKYGCPSTKFSGERYKASKFKWE
jgi:uncharacterized protein YceK